MTSRVAVLVALVVATAMLVAAIAEWMARTRGALQALRQAPVLRSLDAGEQAALAPLRALTGIAHDDQVRPLQGALASASHRPWQPFNDGRLGGVPVLFPAVAHRHLAAWNDAEVVLAAHWAIIVRLNGVALAALPGVGASRLLSERLESDAEVALRRGGRLRTAGLGTAAMALWACAHTPVSTALPLIVLAMLAAGLSWPRRRGPRTAQPVLRVAGRLQNLQRTPAQAPVWLLGRDRRVQLPPEWQDAAAFSTPRVMQLDLRQCDGQVLAAGPHWRLADDRQAFPASGSGWHLAWLALLLAIMGTAAAGSLPGNPQAMLPWWLAAVGMALWQVVQGVRSAGRALQRDSARRQAFAARPPPPRH